MASVSENHRRITTHHHSGGTTVSLAASRPRSLLKRRKIRQRPGAALPAHLGAGAQAAADRRSFDHTEDKAEVVGRQLNTANAGRFAAGHAGDRRRDRRCDAAGPATRTTFHHSLSRGRPARRQPAVFLSSEADGARPPLRICPVLQMERSWSMVSKSNRFIDSCCMSAIFSFSSGVSLETFS